MPYVRDDVDVAREVLKMRSGDVFVSDLERAEREVRNRMSVLTFCL